MGLRIDDLPAHFALRDDVISWERQFWQVEVEPGVFRADTDTTFAMYRPLDRRHEMFRALRTGPPYVARHLPWYTDSSMPSAEETYYRAHADPTMSNWNRDEVARWKVRRMAARARGDHLTVTAERASAPGDRSVRVRPRLVAWSLP